MEKPHSSFKTPSLIKSYWSSRIVLRPFRLSKRVWPNLSGESQCRSTNSINICARSMTFRVKLTPRAQKDAEELYRWVIHRAPHQGSLWYNGLMEAIGTLEHSPQRCLVAPEGRELHR